MEQANVARALALLSSLLVLSGLVLSSNCDYGYSQAAGGAVLELELEPFLDRLAATYSAIRDLDAVVRISSGPQEGKGVLLRVRALLRQRVLRIEYLAPAEMRGQFYTLKGNVLSQYMPVTNLLIIQEITEEHILYPLLQAVNFNLQELLGRLEREGFQMGLTQALLLPGSGLPLTLSLELWLGGGEGLPLRLRPRLSLLEQEKTPAMSLHLSEIELGDYLLEATVPPGLVREGMGFQLQKELVWISADSLLPRRVETHLLQNGRGVVIIAELESIKINRGLTEEEILAVPRDAEILDYRGK